MLFLLDALNRLLNRLFAAPVDALLAAVGVHPVYPTHPISNALTLELVVMTGLIAFFAIVRATLSVEKPGRAQLLAEMVEHFVAEQGDAVIGHDYHRHQAFLTIILLFVLSCNLMGLFPGIDTPTASPVVPLGIALLTFVYYHYIGIKALGGSYIKQFLGPVWWLVPLLFPIEIISHLTRIMSLTIRLYANMFASDLLTLVFFSLIPIGIPIVFLALHFGVALIQSYVFMLLAMIYLSQATVIEH
ncbi:MAG TPA: F0F1 ATP synthase subunit A [Acidobacteriaceae bacterium]